MDERIPPSRFHPHGWRMIRDDAATTHFATGSFNRGVELVAAIGEIASAADGEPDIDLRPEGVTVRLSRHGSSPTEEDLALAERISGVAKDLGVPIDLDGLQTVQITIDGLAIPEVLPFWQAVLGYRKVGDDGLLDRRRVGPPIWFQQMDAARPQRNRIHVDVYVSKEEAQGRIEAALALGGRVVYDRSPYWWTLADPEGNEVDIAPWPDLD
jgi:4a-hydroxytetrahydrobiopterin dehydratase